MHKKPDNTEGWKLSELASHIPEEWITPIEPQGDPTQSPSPERIKQLALQKRREFLNEKEEPVMKKGTMSKKAFRITLVAAIAGIMSITAVAAFNGLDYIKGIFGDSADSIGDVIETPLVSASANGRDMTLEALVTDGYITNMVVSLSGKQPADMDLFSITSTADLRSSGWYELGEFSKAEKTYYAIDLMSTQRTDDTTVTISLNQDVAPINLTFQVENHLGNAVVSFPEGAMSGETELKQLQISSMGFLCIGKEAQAKGSLPSTNLRLIFANGKTETLEVAFDEGDEDASAGGGAIIPGPGQETPLVTSFHGSRNPDGELILSGQFSRIINPSEIKSVELDGVEYPVN